MWVIAITQQIDLSSPVGHLIASLLFGIAEIELRYARERQAAGRPRPQWRRHGF
jgi:DNA invertase Pin-like site-specific DNA recombinase